MTPLGEALKTGAPGAARPTILTLASDWMSRGLGQLLYSVQTGQSGFEQSLGMPFFDWLAKHPDEASMFSETMVGFHGAEPPAVATAYDFSGLTTIVDIGGATGNLLATILGRYPGSRGVLYYLPHVLRDAPALIQARGLTDRVALEAGSFFEKVPGGGDAGQEEIGASAHLHESWHSRVTGAHRFGLGGERAGRLPRDCLNLDTGGT